MTNPSPNATGPRPEAGAADIQGWPSLPQGIKNGVAGQAGPWIYVGLGSAGAAFYGLDLTRRTDGWVALAPFPGPATDGAAAAVAQGKLYVFSGAGKTRAEDAAPVVFTSAHVYDPARNTWQLLDTETPVGLLGAAAHAIDDDRIAFFGGYDKNRFDTFLRDLQAVDKQAEPEKWQSLMDGFMGMEPRDYHWNAGVWVYSISGNAWSCLGETDFLPTCGTALVAEAGRITLINGEIKPGLRTAAIAEVRLEDGQLCWTGHEQLPAVPGEPEQEGLAGAFAGLSNGALIVAGGVNFPGAQANARAGNWYAHKGLTKIWHSAIHAKINGVWTHAGHLPAGLAYGASFSIPEGMLVVGGENAAMTAQSDVYLIRWTGSEIAVG